MRWLSLSCSQEIPAGQLRPDGQAVLHCSTAQIGDLWVFRGLLVRVTSPSDLTVITVVCGTRILVYLLPRTDPLRQLNKVDFFLYTMTPLENPLVYSLRHREVREALGEGQPWSALSAHCVIRAQ